MGAQELATLWEIKQALAAMPEKDRERVNICVLAIRRIVEANQGNGEFAIALIGAELAAADGGGK